MTKNVQFVVEPVPALELLEREWCRVDDTGRHSFFLSWAWIGTWLRSQPTLSSLRLLRASEQGRTVGLAILTLRESKIRKLLPVRQAWLNAAGDPALDCITIEHNGFASPCSIDEAFWICFDQWFANDGLDVDELILPGVGANSGWAEANPKAHLATEQSSNLILVDHLEPGYRTPLANVGAEGIASLLSRNGRQQLRRSFREYQRVGSLAVTPARDLSSALTYFTAMKKLHIRSWTRRGQRHAFTHPFFEDFHRKLIADYWSSGGIELLRISAGESVLGYLYNFRRHGTVYSYQSGFDDAAPGSRPGYVCHALAIAHYAREGMEHYDFLAQSNRLKRSFGFQEYRLCSRRLRKPIWGFRAEAFLRKALGK